MNHIRVYLGSAFALTGILIIPVSFTFGEQKLTDAQKKAMADCKTKQTACVAGCSLEHGARDGPNRLSRFACDDKCKEQYLTCVFSVRRTAAVTEPGQASPPQVAPPKPTPRKISPEQVGGVSTDRAGATTSPLPRKPIDRGSASATTVKDSQSATMTKTATAHRSPTPDPRKKKKKE